MKAIAIRLEAIKLEAIEIRLEALAIRLEAIASRLEALLVGFYRLGTQTLRSRCLRLFCGR